MKLELFETFNSLSEKRKELLIAIGILLAITLTAYLISKFWGKNKTLSTIFGASFFIEISFAIPIALNLSFQKDGPGPVILQSFITIIGGMVVLLGYIENRRKNDIDESKNLDEKIQKLHSSRYERNTKSIELIFSEKTPAALSAVYSLCKITDEWLEDYVNGDKKTNLSSLQESQSIINVLCTYIREYGKPSGKNTHEEKVCKIIMEEICNRLNSSNNGYSDWSDFTFDFEGATFTYPVIFKNITDINKINLNGCTFMSDLEIYFSTEHNNQHLREVLINHCTFEGSVILAPSSSTSTENEWATVSSIAFGDSHFAKNSQLEVTRLRPLHCDPRDPESTDKEIGLPIYIYGDLPANTSFKYTPHANIIVGQKYDSRDSNNSGAIQYTTIQGNILIEQCDDTSFEIPDRHTFNGEINISCSQVSIKKVKIVDCILCEKITVKAARVKEIDFTNSKLDSGLDVDCSGKIGNLLAPDTDACINGSQNPQSISYPNLINSKSNVRIKAEHIKLLNLNGSNLYTPFNLEAPEIQKMDAIKTTFHTSIFFPKNLTVVDSDLSDCKYYDSKQKKYLPFTLPQKS